MTTGQNGSQPRTTRTRMRLTPNSHLNHLASLKLLHKQVSFVRPNAGVLSKRRASLLACVVLLLKLQATRVSLKTNARCSATLIWANVRQSCSVSPPETSLNWCVAVSNQCPKSPCRLSDCVAVQHMETALAKGRQLSVTELQNFPSTNFKHG